MSISFSLGSKEDNQILTDAVKSAVLEAMLTPLLQRYVSYLSDSVKCYPFLYLQT